MDKGPIPLYYQVRSILEGKIRDGQDMVVDFDSSQDRLTFVTG